LRAQIVPILEETAPVALKVGMLPTAGLVLEVANLIRDHDLPAPVVDPVLRSSSGGELMEPEAIPVLLRELLPLVRLLTPNVPEAEIITGIAIESEADMRAAAVKFHELGARAVLIKGGHLKQSLQVGNQQANDLLYNEGKVTVFKGEWLDAQSVRGTGCLISSAIAACLAQEVTLEESVRRAKEYVAEVIRAQRSHTVTRF